MEKLEDRTIERSKKKTLKMALFAVGFVVVGVWLLELSGEAADKGASAVELVLVYFFGVLTVSFGGVGAIYLVRKLFDQSPGLVIGQKGLIDNASGVSVGFVPWSDIVDIGQNEIQKTKFISVFVKDPEKYAKRGNFIQRRLTRASVGMAGAPINIATNTLKVGHDELWTTLKNYFEKSRQGI